MPLADFITKATATGRDAIDGNSSSFVLYRKGQFSWSKDSGRSNSKAWQGWGTGVVVYTGGHVYGGDRRSHVLTGTYTQQGDAITVRLHVKQMVAGLMTVMGRNEYDLDLAGKLDGNTLHLSGCIPGTEMHLSAVHLKQCEVPPK